MLVATLVMQTAFFFVFLDRPVRPIADNARYETAGYNLSIGRGIALPYELAADPRVRDWVCSRHPNACSADGVYPTAIYAPGYSIFLGAIYVFFGHSLVAVAALQLALLWLMFVLFEMLAAKLLDTTGYLFVMCVAMLYPFLARQAGMIMSDHLHAALVLAGFAAWLLMRPGVLRGAVVGGLLAGAALARPHICFVMPVLLLLPSIRRALRGTWREWFVLGAVFALPICLWTARNAYWYGRFIPFTTYKMGTSILWTTWEWEPPTSLFADRTRWDQTIISRFEGDECAQDVSERAFDEAKVRIREHPGKFLWRLVVHVPRYWVSFGEAGTRPRFWFVMPVYLGGLLLLGVVGLWLKRHDGLWHPFLVLVIGYTLFLLPFTYEARRTLPLRLPMLLFAGAAVSHAFTRWLCHAR